MHPIIHSLAAVIVSSVIVSGLFILNPFLTVSAAAASPGPADSIVFQDPPSGMCAIVDQGTTYPVRVQAFDQNGNKVDQTTTIRVESLKPEIGKIAANEVESDETGLAIFYAQIVNGTMNDTFPIIASLVAQPERTDTACMIVGRPRDRLWIYYNDTEEYDAAEELSGCAGYRLPVTIRASIHADSLPNQQRNTSFTIMLTTGLEAYADVTSPEPITSSQLVNGEVVIWINATGKNVSNGTIVVASNDPAVVSGERANINFTSCFKWIEHAAYFSDNGFGQVNRVEIYYDSAIADYEIPDSIQLFWPNVNTGRMVWKGATINIDPNDQKHLTITIPKPFGPDTTRYIGSNAELGISYWNNPLTPEAPKRIMPFAIDDSVGPLIIDAVLTERLTAGNDTVVLSFSETIDYSLVSGASLVLIRDGTEIVIGVIEARLHDDGRSVVTVIDGAVALTQNDSIRINPTGPVTDEFGNHAHQRNRPIALTLSTIAPGVVNAVYLDQDANGRLETVRVTFNKTVDPSNMYMSVSWIGKTSLNNIGPENIIFHGADGMTVDADFSMIFDWNDIDGETWANMQVTVFFLDYSENNEFSRQVEDGAAPVLDYALFEYGEPISASGLETLPSHLSVRFTEPVDNPPVALEPFTFERNGVAYIVYVEDFHAPEQQGDGGWKYWVAALEVNYFPESGDLVSINTAGENTVDNNGNVQRVSTNRRVPLEIKGTIPSSTGEPGPFDPGPEPVGEPGTGNSGCGGCGTGTGLAFIPPLFYFSRQRIRRNRN